MTSPKYSAGFRSQEREIERDSLPVEGRLPKWLSGRLLRTGPAKFEVEDDSYNHWFDGLAMLHAFSFGDGQVSYANKFLHSKSLDEAVEHGRVHRSEFATDPCRSIFGRVMSLFSPKITDNANVNITRLGEHVVSMTETPMPIEFDPETLETQGGLDIWGEAQADATTAHPHFDHRRGRAFNYVLKFGRTSTYRVVSVDPDTLEREVIGRVDTDRPAYMHSFGMTEDHVVLVAYPFVVNPLKMLFSGQPFIANYRWKPERGTRFWVMRKEDGAIVAEHRAEARFGFHHVNAFEDGDDVVVDIVTYPDPSIIDRLYLDRLRSTESHEVAGRLERFRLEVGREEAGARRLSEAPIELPRINYRRSSTRPYKYVWGVGQRSAGNFVDQIVRVDVTTGEPRSWYESGCYPGEPVFVERPEAEAADGEADDGVILSVVLDADTERSFLLVLDARTLEEIGRATVPLRIPFQFHGDFFRDSGQASPS